MRLRWGKTRRENAVPPKRAAVLLLHVLRGGTAAAALADSQRTRGFAPRAHRRWRTGGSGAGPPSFAWRRQRRGLRRTAPGRRGGAGLAQGAPRPESRARGQRPSGHARPCAFRADRGFRPRSRLPAAGIRAPVHGGGAKGRGALPPEPPAGGAHEPLVGASLLGGALLLRTAAVGHPPLHPAQSGAGAVEGGAPGPLRAARRLPASASRSGLFLERVRRSYAAGLALSLPGAAHAAAPGRGAGGGDRRSGRTGPARHGAGLRLPLAGREGGAAPAPRRAAGPLDQDGPARDPAPLRSLGRG